MLLNCLHFQNELWWVFDEGRNVKSSGNEQAQFNTILTKENLMALASNQYGILCIPINGWKPKIDKNIFFLPHENQVMKS